MWWETSLGLLLG